MKPGHIRKPANFGNALGKTLAMRPVVGKPGEPKATPSKRPPVG